MPWYDIVALYRELGIFKQNWQQYHDENEYHFLKWKLEHIYFRRLLERVPWIWRCCDKDGGRADVILLALCVGNPLVTDVLWRRVLMISMFCAWTNSWANNRNGSELRRHLSLWRHCNGKVHVCYIPRMCDWVVGGCPKWSFSIEFDHQYKIKDFCNANSVLSCKTVWKCICCNEVVQIASELHLINHYVFSWVVKWPQIILIKSTMNTLMG